MNNKTNLNSWEQEAIISKFKFTLLNSPYITVIMSYRLQYITALKPSPGSIKILF